MRIEIDYNGSIAKCMVNGKPFMKCDHFDQVFALDAFRTIEQHYKREVKMGCIDDENRIDQEHFDCIECGHTDNADHNAAINIKNRVTVTVLQKKLLKQLDNGAFAPKKLGREKVKEVLLSFRRGLRQTSSDVTIE